MVFESPKQYPLEQLLARQALRRHLSLFHSTEARFYHLSSEVSLAVKPVSSLTAGGVGRLGVLQASSMTCSFCVKTLEF